MESRNVHIVVELVRDMVSPGFILDLEYVLAVFWQDTPCWPDRWGACWSVMLKPAVGEFMARFWL